MHRNLEGNGIIGKLSTCRRSCSATAVDLHSRSGGDERAGRAQIAQHARRDMQARAGGACCAEATQEGLACARARLQLDVQVAAVRIAAQALRRMRKPPTLPTGSIQRRLVPCCAALVTTLQSACLHT